MKKLIEIIWNWLRSIFGLGGILPVVDEVYENRDTVEVEDIAPVVSEVTEPEPTVIQEPDVVGENPAVVEDVKQESEVAEIVQEEVPQNPEIIQPTVRSISAAEIRVSVEKFIEQAKRRELEIGRIHRSKVIERDLDNKYPDSSMFTIGDVLNKNGIFRHEVPISMYSGSPFVSIEEIKDASPLILCYYSSKK